MATAFVSDFFEKSGDRFDDDREVTIYKPFQLLDLSRSISLAIYKVRVKVFHLSTKRKCNIPSFIFLQLATAVRSAQRTVMCES